MVAAVRCAGLPGNQAAGGRAMVARSISSSESLRAMVCDVVGEFGRIRVQQRRRR